MSLNFRTRSITYKSNLNTMTGACCTSGGCIDTTADVCNELLKNDPTGSFNHNISCAVIDCNEGVCCINGHCEMTTKVGCYARGGFFAGKEFDCDSFDCTAISTEPVQACCFQDSYAADDPANTGYCEDLRPSICLHRGGTPRGPESKCSVIDAAGGCSVTGATAYGKCCVSGQCREADGVEGSQYQHGFTPGDCSAIGGVYGGSGSTCGIDKDQVGGNTFDRSWPCSYPTGACCFGTNPFGGYLYCGSSGHTYGSCLNPPSMGGSGGSAFQVGVTCGVNNVVPLGKIEPSPTPVEDGPAVICEVPGTLSGACCVPTTEMITILGDFLGQEVATGYTCYTSNETGCNAIGGFFKADEDGCDSIAEEGCSCFDQEGTEDCPLLASDIIGVGAINAFRPNNHPDGGLGGIFRECIEPIDLASFMQVIDTWWDDKVQCDIDDDCPPDDNVWAGAAFAFALERQDLPGGGGATWCGDEQFATACTCVYRKNEAGELEHVDIITTEGIVFGDVQSNSYYYLHEWADDNLSDLYPGEVNSTIFFMPSSFFPEFLLEDPEDFSCEKYAQGCGAEGLEESYWAAPGACCYDDYCTYSFDGKCQHYGGKQFFSYLYCDTDCGYLPCCSDTTNPVNLCIDEKISGMTYTEKLTVSHCIDRNDFSSSEFNYGTAIDFVLDPAGPIHNIESIGLVESPEFECEDCASTCGRNRGVCCFGLDPNNQKLLWNVTKEECVFYDGKFARCTGLPFEIVTEGGFNYVNEPFDCSELMGSELAFSPTNMKGISVPAYNPSRMRRGPFRSWMHAKNDYSDPANAAKETWESEDWNNWFPGLYVPPGEGPVDKNGNPAPEYDRPIDTSTEALPNKPWVELRWSAPNVSGVARSGGNAGESEHRTLDLSHSSICSSKQLENCTVPFDVKGTCCVLIDCDSDQVSDSANCYDCIPNVSQCECAVLNNSRSCDNIKWTVNGPLNDSGNCRSCPCSDIDNDEFQVNSDCFTPQDSTLEEPIDINNPTQE